MELHIQKAKFPTKIKSEPRREQKANKNLNVHYGQTPMKELFLNVLQNTATDHLRKAGDGRNGKQTH